MNKSNEMNQPNNIESISTFFTISQYQYRIFDMGHKIYPLSNKHFKHIEEQKETYPTPFKQEAWLGILFWQPATKHEPIIWFIHLPIDEMGLLKRESRDHFIQQTLEQVGEKITETHEHEKNTADLKEQHANSPFAFKPNQEKMAIFNAFAKKTLKQSPSQYYAHVVSYLEGKIGYEQWSFLGLQGIADVIVRLDTEKETQHKLINAIPYLPDTPLMTFGNLLEHAQPSLALSTALIKRLEMEIALEKNTTIDINPSKILLQAALLRALSSAQHHKHRTQAIHIIIQHDVIHHIEILAVVASRFWHELLDKKLLKKFIEALATQPQTSFDNLLLGLITIPNMQAIVRDELKDTGNSQQVAKKTEKFMQRLL